MADGIIRHTSDIMNLILDQRASTVQYIRIQTSPNATTWTTRVDVPSKQSPPSPGLGESFRGKVFYPLTLSDYTLTIPLFLRFQDITAGAVTATSSVYLALEPSQGTSHFWLVTGSIPAGAALANSIHILIPASTFFWIKNIDAATPLMVAFNEGGSEKSLAIDEEVAVEGRVTEIWLRGDGGAADFELRMASQF